MAMGVCDLATIRRRSGDDLATLEQSETAFREDREAEEGPPALMICARADIWIYSPVLEVCSASRPIRPVGSAKAQSNACARVCRHGRG